jgi:hypothetical protein
MRLTVGHLQRLELATTYKRYLQGRERFAASAENLQRDFSWKL